MRLLNIPFLIIVASTLLGILLGYYFPTEIYILFISFFSAIILLSILWYRSKKIFRKGFSFSMATILIFITFGAILVQIHNPKNDANHYTNLFTKENLVKEKGIQFYIKERLKPTAYYYKYVVSIIIIDSTITKGNVLLQIPKDNTQNILDVGGIYTSYTKLRPIPQPLNPEQFDYARYLSTQYIFHQITITPDKLIDHHNPKKSIYRLTDQIRKHINYRLSQYPFTSEQLAIINALILGQRQDLSQETFSEYRDAGAIHILAVSGLHVGILLILLNILLKPLLRFRKHGKLIILILSIILLWCFAFMAGLSSSVLRAVTMFTFVAIGMHIRSKTSTYNALLISMFLLLCWDPLLLFSVGFQLSYLAVFAIIWIQPIFAKRYEPKGYIDKKLWDTFTVTIAAQLGILPLSLFYFHQFPILFFISNLLIIPFLGGILGIGIIVVIGATLGLLPDFLAITYGSIIDTMNTIVGWVAHQNSFIITKIPFSGILLLLLYFLLITSMLAIKKFSYQRLYEIGFGFVLLFCILIYEKNQYKKTEELIIFHHQRNTALGVLENQKLNIYSKDSIPDKTKNFLFDEYCITNNAEYTTTQPLKNSYQYKEKNILIIDSSGIYNIPKLKPDIILLSNSPKIHLDRVINSLQPKQIIADGSNYKSFMHRWELTCIQKNIPFHRTDKKGAYILK
ncbi:ComEC/Rec2 family competence protein [Aquimarina sp. MMG016]|uniref:ComEC/Rec2 family competence protein n=1 Tax=Aquimarina sp. MMG016 TaxID=2822690 RepID=UPI001B3A6E3B|nr:ComEC/Rec2 family competence protein [Aquimarina sp. MMG016]MBQ4818796.1 ComEC/Rec2 family competence protein [Aquimarina sp. MMG016]